MVEQGERVRLNIVFRNLNTESRTTSPESGSNALLRFSRTKLGISELLTQSSVSCFVRKRVRRWILWIHDPTAKSLGLQLDFT